MARLINDLYIGAEYLNKQGREIKHQGLIREFGTVNAKKTTDKPLKLIGLDIETNYKTAELKLFGTWNGETYSYYTNNFIGVIFNVIYLAYWAKDETALAYWNKLDPFVIYKQFLLFFDKEKQYKSMERYGKISGEWNKKEGVWKVRPVIEVEITRGSKTFRFGIKNVIRSSVQFYFYELIAGTPKQGNNGQYFLSTVWAYDIAQLYKYGLEKEMTDRKDQFPYYSKVSKEAHLVDWERFARDKDFREQVVLYSNQLDAVAVYDLGNLIITNFKKAFHYFPRNLISSGAIARAAIVGTIMHKYMETFGDEKIALKLTKNDIKTIGLQNHYNNFKLQLTDNELKDMYCLFFEAYSGGYIEAFRYGLIEAGHSADLASAYIKHITELMNLTGATVTHGNGAPPRIDNSYCFIRGAVKIPLNVNYMPITVKDIDFNDRTNTQKYTSTNVRAAGEYIASYTINERDYMLKLGATFKDETWYNLETKGEKSPIAVVAQDFINLRYELLKQKDSAEYLAKTAAASLYGILFEATNTWVETDQLEIAKNGYRGGEFLNSCYAAWITAETRIQMAEAGNLIEENGGQVVLFMTDCVFWNGPASCLPSNLIREKKTLGYFEKPVPFNQMACLGTGRYSYVDDKKGYVTTKNRGLNISSIHDPDGIIQGTYNWIDGLKLAERNNSFKLDVNVRALVSVGMVLHNGDYELEDLGKVVEQTRTVDLITGQAKRVFIRPPLNIQDITRGSIGTRSKYFSFNMLGDGKLVDQSLPLLRDEVMKMTVITKKERRRNTVMKAKKKHYKNNKEIILKTERDKYKYLRDLGYTRIEAKLWCKRGMYRIQTELLGG